jgi:hypothetical protein
MRWASRQYFEEQRESGRPRDTERETAASVSTSQQLRAGFQGFQGSKGVDDEGGRASIIIKGKAGRGGRQGSGLRAAGWELHGAGLSGPPEGVGAEEHSAGGSCTVGACAYLDQPQ